MGEAADKLDELAEPAAEPDNAVLVDNARVVRWAGPACALFSLILLPWTVYLGYSLPSRQVSADYDIAWAGFDVILLVALASTGLPSAAAIPVPGDRRDCDGDATRRGCLV